MHFSSLFLISAATAAISKDSIYCAINGMRKDNGQAPLKVAPRMEETAKRGAKKWAKKITRKRDLINEFSTKDSKALYALSIKVMNSDADLIKKKILEKSQDVFKSQNVTHFGLGSSKNYWELDLALFEHLNGGTDPKCLE